MEIYLTENDNRETDYNSKNIMRLNRNQETQVRKVKSFLFMSKKEKSRTFCVKFQTVIECHFPEIEK